MDQAEAEARVASNAREHPERDTHRWLAQHVEGDEWRVVKVKVPKGMRVDPLKATIETKPKPPEPDDVRSSLARNVPGYWN